MRKRNRSNENGDSKYKRSWNEVKIKTSNYNMEIENINEYSNICKNENMKAKFIENKINILK